MFTSYPLTTIPPIFICMQTVVCGSPLFIGTTFIFVEIKAFKLSCCLFARERKAGWVVLKIVDLEIDLRIVDLEIDFLILVAERASAVYFRF